MSHWCAGVETTTGGALPLRGPRAGADAPRPCNNWETVNLGRKELRRSSEAPIAVERWSLCALCSILGLRERLRGVDGGLS
jgi:hypothetical protein